mmetsp:Transcript_33949/g.72498  ORF Transcript_33949/g.72498 Transcript_33949/m.72498 type:complete len:141 (-) Transcript_33949:570-992(-)
MKKFTQVSLLTRKRGGGPAAGATNDGSDEGVNEEHRVRYTSAPQVDLTLGEFTLQLKNGQWRASDDSAAASLSAYTAAAAASLGVAGGGNAEVERLQMENKALRGEVSMLKFKIELLIDMVTLANLDCDKLEEELGDIKP